MKPNTAYDAVIFDLFGTLIENFNLSEYKNARARMAAAVSVSAEEFSRLWSETFKDRMLGVLPSLEANVRHICSALNSTASAVHIRTAAQMAVDFTRSYMVTPRADAITTLQGLKNAGLKIALVSDCSPEVPIIWPDTHFAPLFDEVIFSCSEGCKKPDTRIYHLACTRLGVPPERCLYVGDGCSRELDGALSAGLNPVLIRPAYQVDDQIFRAEPQEWSGPMVKSLSEVLGLVFS